jgi:phage terminase small subunit
MKRSTDVVDEDVVTLAMPMGCWPRSRDDEACSAVVGDDLDDDARENFGDDCDSAWR